MKWSKYLGKRTKKGITEYLIKWLRYDNDSHSWEPVTHLYYPAKIDSFETGLSIIFNPEERSKANELEGHYDKSRKKSTSGRIN